MATSLTSSGNQKRAAGISLLKLHTVGATTGSLTVDVPVFNEASSNANCDLTKFANDILFGFGSEKVTIVR